MNVVAIDLEILHRQQLTVRTDASSLAQYGRDWTRHWTPQPTAIVFPQTLEQIQFLVKWANEQRVALVPSGGRTGLSGGAVAYQGEIVVSLEKMNRILDFDPIERTVRCEAGVITEVLQQFAKEKGLYYPVDFAARGSSQIGGNIATNAGGIKVLRYGLTRDWVTDLTVVTGTGDCLHLNRGLIKNATGYDLRHLFIGSEGTLGIIVEATIKLTLPPPELAVMVFAVPSLNALTQVFQITQKTLPLQAFEFFSDKALNHVLAKGLMRPFETETPYYALVEFEVHDPSTTDKAMALFEQLAEAEHVLDGVLSQNQTQAAQLWQLREDITESIAVFTPYKNDIALRIKQIPAFLDQADGLFNRLYPDFEVIWFGHIGDGNLHISVLKPQSVDQATFEHRCHEASNQLFELLEQFGGTISAEHGVGLLKKPFLHYTRPPTEIAYLQAIRRAFDPNGILNPGKLFD